METVFISYSQTMGGSLLVMSGYCKTEGIILNTTITYWPQQNGEVERQNRSLLKRIRISHAEGSDWEEEMDRYLMMYRSIIHSTTVNRVSIQYRPRHIMQIKLTTIRVFV